MLNHNRDDQSSPTLLNFRWQNVNLAFARASEILSTEIGEGKCETPRREHVLKVSIKGKPPEVGTPESSHEWVGEALNFQNGIGCVGGREYGGGGELAS